MSASVSILFSPRRIRRVAFAVAAALGAGVIVAQAAGTNAGDAQTVTPGTNALLTSGTKDTDFTLKLPAGAACTGDSANDGYRVQSYHVPSTVDPGTLTFDPSGPIPNATGANFRQPLYQTNGNPYVDAQTAPANPAPGPGQIINIPAFDFALYDATSLPPGTYNIGIACTKGAASATQQDKYWNVRITFAGDLSWTTAGSSSTTTAAPTTTSTTVAPTTTSTVGPTTSTSTAPTTTSTVAPTTSTTTVATTSTTATPTTAAPTSTTAPTSGTTSTTASPNVTLSSPTATPGGSLTVRAGGYAPNSQAELFMLSSPVFLASATADANGVVQATVTIPRNATPGQHTMEVRGTGANGESRVLAQAFTVAGTLPRTGGIGFGAALLGALFIVAGAYAMFMGRTPLRHSLRG